MLRLLLDSNILSRFVRPEVAENKVIANTILFLIQDPQVKILLPAIIDYELRRKLLHLSQHRHQGRKWAGDALTILNGLGMLNYLPLTDETLKLAAQLWAQTRAEGKQRCPDGGLDIDIILAAQARQVGGKVMTENEKHFLGLVEIFDWRSIGSLKSSSD